MAWSKIRCWECATQQSQLLCQATSHCYDNLLQASMPHAALSKGSSSSFWVTSTTTALPFQCPTLLLSFPYPRLHAPHCPMMVTGSLHITPSPCYAYAIGLEALSKKHTCFPRCAFHLTAASYATTYCCIRACRQSVLTPRSSSCRNMGGHNSGPA
jgi:hypothetical protein